MMVWPVLFILASGAAATWTGHSWVITDGAGAELQRFDKLGGLKPSWVEPVPGGGYVFTAEDASATQAKLYFIWGEVAVSIGHPHGLHTAPTVSADGKWVYFAYHPDPRLMGTSREYTQIWRVKLNGYALEQLTFGYGCKLTPDGRVPGKIVYAHAECGTGNQSIKLKSLDFGAPPVALTPADDDNPIEPRLSPDGKKLAYGVITKQGTEIRVMDVTSSRSAATVWRSAKRQAGIWLHWAGSTQLRFQADHAAHELSVQ